MQMLKYTKKMKPKTIYIPHTLWLKTNQPSGALRSCSLTQMLLSLLQLWSKNQCQLTEWGKRRDLFESVKLDSKWELNWHLWVFMAAHEGVCMICVRMCDFWGRSLVGQKNRLVFWDVQHIWQAATKMVTCLMSSRRTSFYILIVEKKKKKRSGFL